MAGVYRFLATSEHPVARAVRRVHRGVHRLTLPAPRAVVRPMLWAFLAARSVYYFGVRVFVCEPLFKAACAKYGRGMRTGTYIHWVEGPGQILIGDEVLIDGKCAFNFATRYCDRPILEVGDRTTINHDCRLTVGKRITIGRRCHIASGVWMFDSSGHPSDPDRRAAGLPADDEDVRPITIGDDVWIGTRSMVYPGVIIGAGSIVSAGSVVLADVPPDTIVAGNPARRITSVQSAGGAVSEASRPYPSRSMPREEVHPSTTATEADEITATICRVGKIPGVDLDDDFYGAGFSSINALGLLIELESAYGVSIPDDRFIEARTARALQTMISGLRQEQAA